MYLVWYVRVLKSNFQRYYIYNWMFFLLLTSSGLFFLVCRKCIYRRFEGMKNHIEIFHFTDYKSVESHYSSNSRPVIFHTYQMTRHLAWNTTLWCHGHILWQYGLSSFQVGGIKLGRFLPKNQYTQRKFLNFENWTNGEPQ